MLCVYDDKWGHVEELNFLSRKLCGGSLEMNDQAALSHVLCRLAAYIHPQHPFSTQLVAEHMASLLATSAERTSSLVSYVAEPKLAMAAAMKWKEPNTFARKLIPALQRALAGGALDNGSRGELVAQIVMLFAFDRACVLSRKYPGECVVLRSVLEQLLPESAELSVLDALPAELLQSLSACCQFVNFCHTFGHGELVALAERHCGASFRDKQEGADLAVPILCSATCLSNIGKAAGLLLIQSQNWNDDEPTSLSTPSMLDPPLAYAMDELSAQQARTLSERSVRVVMQLGASQCHARTRPDRQGRSVLELYGMGARCLDQEARSALGVVLSEHVTLTSFVESNGFEEVVAGRRLGPDPDTLRKVRGAWPFVAEPNPTLGEMTTRELREACGGRGVEAGSDDTRDELIRKLEAVVDEARP